VKINVDAKTPDKIIAGIPVKTGARVVIAPRFACSLDELRAKFPSPGKVHVSDTSTLVLDGSKVVYFFGRCFGLKTKLRSTWSRESPRKNN
jgi:hypothetical protein